MQAEKIDEILKAVKVSATHPLFYSRVYTLVVKHQKSEPDPIKGALIHEYEELSRRLDRSQVQESCSVRNILRTRRLAQLLINEKGELELQLIQNVLPFFKQHLYSLGPLRQYDAKRQEHIYYILEQLVTNKNLGIQFKRISRPLSNPWIEELIRYTLDLPSSTALTDVHAKQATLAAWLAYLRQNVGSCFATAPAEIVHAEQPELFLQDMLDLLSTGRLKRTYEGVEHSVPLSASWGSGDLRKPLFMEISSKRIRPEVWFSPGLLVALEEGGIIARQQPLKQKIEQLKKEIENLAREKARPYSMCVLTVEEILRFLILQACDLTESQIKEYENRPQAMIQTQLIMHTPQVAKKSGGIGERCANFLQLLEQAKNRFKAYADHALLKAWEFTLASFAETKIEFSNWNLYASLGMGSNESGGIGQTIYQTIQQKLEQVNRKIQDIQYDYEMVYTQVKTLETRMKHTSTEQELKWLKVEYQGRTGELYFLQDQVETAQSHANALVNLYDNLYKIYMNYFKDYFQEVYDADMQEVTTGPFDDSPAGFRLLYKYGRSNTAQWTRIRNPREFVDALSSFFVATESQVAHAFDNELIQKDLSDVITAIIMHVKTKEFLESAFYRMAAAHQVPAIKNPLEHLDQIEKKPWAYTSGGTMNTLIGAYYRISDQPKQIKKWVENEAELLVFLADTLKQMPQMLLNPYLKGKRLSLLMQSPTHAFLLKPTNEPFRETWLNDEFTYTSVRDRFIRPAEIFIDGLLLNNEMIQWLIELLVEKIPENFRPRFKFFFNSLKGPLNPVFFREAIVEGLLRDRGLQYGSRQILASEEIDSLLFSHLPLFSITDLRSRINQIFLHVPQISSEQIHEMLKIFDQTPTAIGQLPVVSAQQLQNICKALLCLNKDSTTTAIDYHWEISLAAQHLGYALPFPVIFADTNWVKDEFGFVVNPGTGRLELWRLDYTGSYGYPMSSWKQWVNGSHTSPKWGVYVNPVEYGQV